MRRAAGRAPRRGRARARARPRSAIPPARRPRGSGSPSQPDPTSIGRMLRVTAAELERLAEGVGLDVVGAAPAAAYEETERHIRERRARGLFADMRFTMAQPEVSCHPEWLLPGARTVVSAAL